MKGWERIYLGWGENQRVTLLQISAFCKNCQDSDNAMISFINIFQALKMIMDIEYVRATQHLWLRFCKAFWRKRQY